MGIPITIRLFKAHRRLARRSWGRKSDLSRFQNSSGLSILLVLLQGEYPYSIVSDSFFHTERIFQGECVFVLGRYVIE